MLDVAVVGDHAFCGTGLGLAVIDLSDPAHPRLQADYYLGAAGHNVIAQGNHVYLVNYGTLFIFDVSNPSQPVLLGQIPLGGDLDYVAMSGSTFVAADLWSKLVVIVDVSDPIIPRVVARHPLPLGARGIAIHDSVVYMTVNRRMLQTFDISDPTLLVPIASDSAFVESIVLDYPYLYGSYGSTPLIIWDVSDPAHPRQVSKVLQAVGSVLVAGNRAYVRNSGRLAILDVSDPVHPIVIVERPFSGLDTPKGILSTSGALATKTAESALKVFDVADTAALPEIGRHPFNNYFSRIKVYRECLFATLASSGELHVFDITNRESPALTRTYSEAGPVKDFVLRNDTMYMAGQGVHAVDVSDPLALRVLAESNGDTAYQSIRLQDTLIYATRASGLDIFDFDEFDSLSQIGTFSMTHLPNEASGQLLELQDGMAYMSNWIWVGRLEQADVIQKIDISDATAPTNAGRTRLVYSLTDLKFQSGIGYLLDSYDGFDLYDFTDPIASPTFLKRVWLPDGTTAINLHGDVAYLGTYYRGVLLVDVSDPRDADTIGRFDPGAGSVISVEIADSIAYIAAGHGLVVARLSVSPATDVDEAVRPEAFVLDQNYPNPFNAETRIRFTLSSPGTVSLSIFDLLGRHVTTLVDGTRTSGRHEELWDGRNSFGQEMGSGVYFYRLKAGATESCRKMLLLK